MSAGEGGQPDISDVRRQIRAGDSADWLVASRRKPAPRPPAPSGSSRSMAPTRWLVEEGQPHARLAIDVEVAAGSDICSQIDVGLKGEVPGDVQHRAFAVEEARPRPKQANVGLQTQVRRTLIDDPGVGRGVAPGMGRKLKVKVLLETRQTESNTESKGRSARICLVEAVGAARNRAKAKHRKAWESWVSQPPVAKPVVCQATLCIGDGVRVKLSVLTRGDSAGLRGQPR